MNIFEPQKVKQQLRSEVGIEYFLARSLDDAAASRALTRGADMRIIEGIRCIVVDFDDDACHLLRKAKQWLEHAIATEEKPRYYFQYGTEAGRHENLALCNWLLSNVHDEENLNAAVRYHELYDIEERLEKQSAAIVLPVYVDAGDYQTALDLFERYWPAKRPRPIARLTGEAAMSYIIAAAKARSEYSNEEVRMALDGFLRHRTPKFLERGLYSNLTRWLKIAHWNDKRDRASAFETVRKCYDYLPNVVRPKFA